MNLKPSALIYEHDFAILFLQHLDTESGICLVFLELVIMVLRKDATELGGEGCCWQKLYLYERSLNVKQRSRETKDVKHF